jgi:hypothetical protein
MSTFIASVTKRKKTPEKLVRLCLQHLQDLSNTESEDEVCKRLSDMKTVLYGSGDKLEVDEEKAQELSIQIQSVNFTLC